jgi:hypothetical protein
MRIWTAISYNTIAGAPSLEVFHGPFDPKPAAKVYTKILGKKDGASKLVALIPGDHAASSTVFGSGVDVGGLDFPSGF